VSEGKLGAIVKARATLAEDPAGMDDFFLVRKRLSSAKIFLGTEEGLPR
jgi:hypothetical protein